MDLIIAVNALRELGHPTRLSVYRGLVIAGKPAQHINKKPADAGFLFFTHGMPLT